MKKWFVKSCFIAWLPASPYLCGYTYWKGVRRSSVGSSITSIEKIYMTQFWCSLRTQVGHASSYVGDYKEVSQHDCEWRFVVFAQMWFINNASTKKYVLIKSFGSPVVKFTTVIPCRTGNIIIQARKITGEDEAFQVQAMLPLLKWIRLDCYIQDSEVKRWWDEE